MLERKLSGKVSRWVWQLISFCILVEELSMLPMVLRNFTSLEIGQRSWFVMGRLPARMCGIIGIFKHLGLVNFELYEGLLMLQHRGQDTAGIVSTDWVKFKEHRSSGLVKDAFSSSRVLDKLIGVFC